MDTNTKGERREKEEEKMICNFNLDKKIGHLYTDLSKDWREKNFFRKSRRGRKRGEV